MSIQDLGSIGEPIAAIVTVVDSLESSAPRNLVARVLEAEGTCTMIARAEMRRGAESTRAR